MSSKYIVRQPIKDAAGTIIGYEILYHGENEAFSNDNGTSSADFAAADTIYNFLTQNSTKVLKGTSSSLPPGIWPCWTALTTSASMPRPPMSSPSATSLTWGTA